MDHGQNAFRLLQAPDSIPGAPQAAFQPTTHSLTRGGTVPLTEPDPRRGGHFHPASMPQGKRLKRRTIAREELHALLQEEFALRAGAQCVGCRLPMPVYFAGAREGANWRLPPLDECSSLCHTLVDELRSEE